MLMYPEYPEKLFNAVAAAMKITLNTAIEVTAGVVNTRGKTTSTIPAAAQAATLAQRAAALATASDLIGRPSGGHRSRSSMRTGSLRPRRQLSEETLWAEGEHDQQHQEVDHG